MRLKPEDKEKVRRRILAAAATAFRARGIEAVTLDDLMKGARLTRGAFYAHFPSKAALVADVLENEHPLQRMLKARDGRDGAALWQQMVAIFEGYLAVENLEQVYTGCTLAALTSDAARGDRAFHMAYQTALTRMAEEMARGLSVDRDGLLPVPVIASGAVNAARACADAEIQARILEGAWQQVRMMLDAARPQAHAGRP